MLLLSYGSTKSPLNFPKSLFTLQRVGAAFVGASFCGGTGITHTGFPRCTGCHSACKRCFPLQTQQSSQKKPRQSMCHYGICRSQEVFVQREMFLNSTDPAAQRTQLTGPEPRVGCVPGAQLCSPQFTASKLLEMPTSLTSAESNNWGFFCYRETILQNTARETDLRESCDGNHDLVGSLLWYLQNKSLQLENVGVFFHLSLDFQIGWEQEGSSKMKTHTASDF